MQRVRRCDDLGINGSAAERASRRHELAEA
jgi:hypothetical protein